MHKIAVVASLLAAVVTSHTCAVSDGSFVFDLSAVPVANNLTIKQVVPSNPAADRPFDWTISLCKPVMPAPGEPCRTAPAFIYKYEPSAHSAGCVQSMTAASDSWAWSETKSAAVRTFTGPDGRASVAVKCDPSAHSLRASGAAVATPQQGTWTWSITLLSSAVCRHVAPAPTAAPAPLSCLVSHASNTFNLTAVPVANNLTIKQVVPSNPAADRPFDWTISLCKPVMPAPGEPCRTAPAFIYKYEPSAHSAGCVQSMTAASDSWAWSETKSAAVRTFTGPDGRASVAVKCDPSAHSLRASGAAVATPQQGTWTWSITLLSSAVCRHVAPAPTAAPAPLSCLVSHASNTFNLTAVPVANNLTIKQVVPSNPAADRPFDWTISLCKPVMPAPGEPCRTAPAFIYKYEPSAHSAGCVQSMTAASDSWAWSETKSAAVRTFTGPDGRASVAVKCDPSAHSLRASGAAVATPQQGTWTWSITLLSSAVC